MALGLARRTACAAVLLGILLDAGPAAARGLGRKCRTTILRGCKHQGLAYCAFGFHLDPTMAPPTPTNADGFPLAAVAVEGGKPATFIANQLAIEPRDRGELEDLLARTGGKVLMDDTVP